MNNDSTFSKISGLIDYAVRMRSKNYTKNSDKYSGALQELQKTVNDYISQAKTPQRPEKTAHKQSQSFDSVEKLPSLSSRYVDKKQELKERLRLKLPWLQEAEEDKEEDKKNNKNNKNNKKTNEIKKKADKSKTHPEKNDRNKEEINKKDTIEEVEEDKENEDEDLDQIKQKVDEEKKIQDEENKKKEEEEKKKIEEVLKRYTKTFGKAKLLQKLHPDDQSYRLDTPIPPPPKKREIIKKIKDLENKEKKIKAERDELNKLLELRSATSMSASRRTTVQSIVSQKKPEQPLMSRRTPSVSSRGSDIFMTALKPSKTKTNQIDPVGELIKQL